MLLLLALMAGEARAACADNNTLLAEVAQQAGVVGVATCAQAAAGCVGVPLSAAVQAACPATCGLCLPPTPAPLPCAGVSAFARGRVGGSGHTGA